MYTKIFSGTCVAIVLSTAWAASPQAGEKDVVITNTALPVLEAAPMEPINACAEAQFGNPTNVLFEVPLDSILIIDHASLNTGILGEEETVTASITTTVAEIEAKYFIGIVSAPPRLGGAATAMRVYADAGTEVTVQRGSVVAGSPVNAEVCISGRLIPLLP